MHTQTTTPIALSESAVVQLKRIMQEQEVPEGYGLRVGVKGGGCSGFSYILGFDVQKEKDRVYEISGIPVYIERSQSMYLVGMHIDWHEGLNNRGFIFSNPNAKSTCGCGSSFST